MLIRPLGHQVKEALAQPLHGRGTRVTHEFAQGAAPELFGRETQVPQAQFQEGAPRKAMFRGA